MPQWSLCHAVAPISPGWKSLTSDLWAVISSEIQSSDGGERDKERHRSNSEQHSLWWFSVSVYVSHKRTMTLTYLLVAGLNGTYKRACCSGTAEAQLSHDAYHTVTYWTLKCTQTHTCTHILYRCWERHYQSQDVCADREKFRASVTHNCCICTDEKLVLCAWVSLWKTALKSLSQDFQGVKVTRIHWNPQMGSLRSWCGCTFQERVDACSESTWI